MTALQGPRAAALAVLAVGIGGLATLGVVAHRVAGPAAPPGIPTLAPATAVATPVPPASPSATAAATIAFADCSAATFGPALGPLNPPAQVHAYTAPPPQTIDATKLYELTIHTARGDLVACLQPTLAPLTVNTIVTLARNHFYDGLAFHRVVKDFVIQGGDPKGDGSGGPGFTFADEPVRQAYGTGVLAMANSGKNTNGSQFFVCIGNGTQCAGLPHSYNLFGRLVSGQDVAERIAQGDVMTTVTVAVQS